MYRAITWLALRRGASLDDPAALAALAHAAPITVEPPSAGSSEPARILVDGVDTTPYLRDPDVEQAVSIVSAVPEVRRVMVELQRRVAGSAIVMAGRDIGTVVLPDAEVKVYLDASAEVRARRRLPELAARGEGVTLAAVLAGLRRRDRIDSSRAVAPLRPAADATVITTDALTVEQVVERVLMLARGERDGR